MDLGVFSLSVLASVVAAFLVAGFGFVPTLLKKAHFFIEGPIDYQICPRPLTVSKVDIKKKP